MHFVDCGAAPVSLLQALVGTNASGKFVWGKGGAYSDFRKHLEQCFSGKCAYCEVKCSRSSGDNLRDEFEHFRPCYYFPDLTFTWENLLYACKRCNRAKGKKFPGITVKPGNLYEDRKDKAGNRKRVDLGVADEYVNPRDPNEPAETFFDFNVENGEIRPKDDLDDLKWAKAYLTIYHLNLNPGYVKSGSLELKRQFAYLGFCRMYIEGKDDKDISTLEFSWLAPFAKAFVEAAKRGEKGRVK